MLTWIEAQVVKNLIIQMLLLRCMAQKAVARQLLHCMLWPQCKRLEALLFWLMLSMLLMHSTHRYCLRTE